MSVTNKPKRHKSLKLIFQLIILFLAIWVLIPRAKELIDNRDVLTNLQLHWLFLGGVVILSSNIFAALVLKFLSYKKLSYHRTLVVQFATGFTNRLLPSGVGGISTNSLLLIHSGYKKAEAVSLALANNIVGFMAFCSVLILSGALAPSFLVSIFKDTPVFYFWIVGAIVLGFIIAALFSPRLKKTLKDNAQQSFGVLRDIARRPLRFLFSIISSSGITVCFIVTLYCALKSAGITLSLSELTLVFAASAVAVSASPTPGGLGGTELAMLVALDRFGVVHAPALAAVVGFRLLSFWLPILPGYLMFRYAGAKKYI